MRRAAWLQRAVHDGLTPGRADLRLDRSLERAHDVASGDVVRVTRERVASAGSTFACDEAGLAQTRNELLEIRLRQLLARGDRVEAHSALAVVAREVDHEPHPVFAARGDMESSLWGNSEHFTRYYAPP